MAQTTIPEALDAFRYLRSVEAGRLTAFSIRGWSTRYDLSPLSDADAQLIREALATNPRETGTITGDHPIYVVLSDRVPVAWLTNNAKIITPDIELSKNQIKHQKLATDALSDLALWPLREMADRRAAREGRTGDYHEEDGGDARRIRVSPASDPTAARWVTIGPDLPTARATVAAVIAPLGDGPERILSARGFGEYDRRDHLALDKLCAILAIADTTTVDADAVGTWVIQVADPQDTIPAEQLREIFSDTFLGKFDGEYGYAREAMKLNGWGAALTAAGIPEEYFKLDAYARHLFACDVQTLDIGSRRTRKIEVFKR